MSNRYIVLNNKNVLIGITTEEKEVDNRVVYLTIYNLKGMPYQVLLNEVEIVHDTILGISYYRLNTNKG
jgi:hypothetical protein